MPPKKLTKTLTNSVNGRKSKTLSCVDSVSDSQKNALTNMFKRIESSDQTLKECVYCHEKIKSCLMKDHLNTKCPSNIPKNTEDEILFLEVKTVNEINTKKEIKIKTENEISNVTYISLNQSFNTPFCKIENVEEVKIDSETKIIESLNDKVELENKLNDDMIFTDSLVNKRLRLTLSTEIDAESSNDSAKDNLLLNQFLDQSSEIFENKIEKTTQVENEIPNSRRGSGSRDYYLENFENAIKSVLDESTFSCLLEEFDLTTIKKFSLLTNPSKILYVRLFQRKYKWFNDENITYENISLDLTENLNELIKESFLIDENSIDSYDEIVHLLKLPQLKELAKTCHVLNLTQNTKKRLDFAKAILQHFKTQKTIKSHFFQKKTQNSESQVTQYMVHCKKILGKCFKLKKQVRDVFVRILMLYSLSSTNHIDPSKTDSGQQNLLQILKVNMGQVKYMNYEIRLTIKIFENRESFIRYQDALEIEANLLNYIEAKEFEEANEEFESKISNFKEILLNKEYTSYDLKLPVYLRGFTAGYIYTKFLSLFAYEVLQRLRKYQEANDLFEFLISQDVYMLTSRGKWYERMALNYEAHLKNPLKSFNTLKQGLCDKLNVRKAARLALYKRLIKMSQTKKYQKNSDFYDDIRNLCLNENYEIREANTVEIEGTLLHAEFIPGRKNIFIQNFESDNEESQNLDEKSDTLIKNRYNLSVEEVAMTYYIKNQGFTNTKHAETVTLRTIFGLLFWDVIFDKNTDNVFVDRFQSAPLDFQTDSFYTNRKELIDNRVGLIKNSTSDILCELVSQIWMEYRNVECALVSWSLFDELDDFLGLLRCFKGEQLGNLCDYMAKNLRYCRSGGPDLVVWSTKSNIVKFVEVKGPGDRLSFKQIVWLDFLIQNSIDCEVCYVKGQSSKRFRE